MDPKFCLIKVLEIWGPVRRPFYPVQTVLYLYVYVQYVPLCMILWTFTIGTILIIKLLPVTAIPNFSIICIYTTTTIYLEKEEKNDRIFIFIFIL